MDNGIRDEPCIHPEEDEYCHCGACGNSVYVSERSWLGEPRSHGLATVQSRNEDGSFHVKFVDGSEEHDLNPIYITCIQSDGSHKRKRCIHDFDSDDAETDGTDIGSPAMFPSRRLYFQANDRPSTPPHTSPVLNIEGVPLFPEESYQSPQKDMIPQGVMPELDIRRELTSPEAEKKLGIMLNFGPMSGKRYLCYCNMDGLDEERFVIFSKSMKNIWEARRQVEFQMLLSFVNAHAPLYEVPIFDETEAMKMLKIHRDINGLFMEEEESLLYIARDPE